MRLDFIYALLLAVAHDALIAHLFRLRTRAADLALCARRLVELVDGSSFAAAAAAAAA